MNKQRQGYIFILITVIFFSTYETVSKTLVGTLATIQVSFWRFLIGGIFLAAILIVKGDWKISYRDMFKVSLVGILNVVISMNLLQYSLTFPGAKASAAAVIFSSNPIFVIIFSAFIEKIKPDKWKVFGLALGLAGVVIIFIEKLNFSSLDLRSPLLALGSACTYGLYTVLGRTTSIKIGSLKMNAYSFILGSLFLLPFSLVTGSPIAANLSAASGRILYLGIFVTGIAYFSYFRGLSIVGAGSGSLVFFLKPILAAFIAVIVLKEAITLNLVIGTSFVILGITVALYG
ncbi:MAG: EamA family transporter, partial [Clostridiaceae bacterium]